MAGQELDGAQLVALAMPLAVLGVYTSICSNWRTTAEP
jgi:hypothetical protein